MLLCAGLATGAGQILLKHLTGANGIDTTEAIWFYAGRMPASAHARQRAAFHFRRGDGDIARARRRAEASGRGAGEFLFRPRTIDATNSAGCWLPAARGREWRRRTESRLGGALFSLEVMRGALALRYVLARADHLARGHGGLVAGAAECADLHNPGLRQFAVVRGVGAAGWSDCGRGLCRLCPDDSLGGPAQAAELAAADRSGDRAGVAWGGVDMVSANPRERQGCLAAGIHESGAADAAARFWWC